LANTYFATVERGWIVGDSDRAWTFQTEDGGLTWRRWKEAGAMNDAFFLNNGHGWADIYDDTEKTHQSYRSDDWGKTWAACGAKLKGNGPRRAYFVTPELGWAVFESDTLPFDKVAKTDDGGCTWREVSETKWLGRNPLHWVDLHFLDKRTGWLLGTSLGVLLRTLNGGRAWQRVALPRGLDLPDSVYFSSIHEGWILGTGRAVCEKDSGVFHTVDGGASWRQLTPREVFTGTFSVSGRPLIPARWKVGKLWQIFGGNAFSLAGDQTTGLRDDGVDPHHRGRAPRPPLAGLELPQAFIVAHGRPCAARNQ
jgi:photosystem II stability/assembly factor-like uncharacterized protein